MGVCRCMQVCTGVGRCITFYTFAYLCTPLHTCTHLSTPVHTQVWQIDTGLDGCGWVCAGLCWFMQVCTGLGRFITFDTLANHCTTVHIIAHLCKLKYNKYTLV